MPKETLPKYSDFQWPTVVALRALGGSGTNSEIDQKVIEQQGYSEELQSILHNNGPMTEIGYRLHWARSWIKSMGLADNPRRGVWALTPAGRDVSEAQMAPLRATSIKASRDARAAANATGAMVKTAEAEVEAEASWQDRLLEALLAMDPAAFERLCQRLLREAGFSRTQVTGRSGDGGIDGLGVYRVSLVSFQVFYQAKRWRNAVGAKEVRDFRGAMAGRGEKGLLITTSTFTNDAKAESTRDGAPPVDLVDGTALCDLLVQHRLGVVVRERIELDVQVDQAALDAI
jgi:restriction system protein